MILKKTKIFNFCWPTNFLQNQHRHSSWYIDSSVTNPSVVSKEINNKRENEEPQQSFSTLKKCRRSCLKKMKVFPFWICLPNHATSSEAKFEDVVQIQNGSQVDPRRSTKDELLCCHPLSGNFYHSLSNRI